jgi:hypothetical protein
MEKIFKDGSLIGTLSLHFPVAYKEYLKIMDSLPPYPSFVYMFLGCNYE